MKRALSRALAILMTAVSLNAAIAPEVLLPSPSLQAALKPAETGEHPARRFDVILFIALPFAILFSTLMPTILSFGTGLRASATAGVPLGLSDFTWSNLYLRSDILFIGINSVLWSTSIAVNDFQEGREPLAGEKLKRAMDANRIDLTLLRLAF
jgi:hypothetical protein